MGSQRHTLSRLIHGDNLKNWPEAELELIKERVYEHTQKCQHPKCIEINSINGGENLVMDLVIGVEEHALY